MKFEIKVPKEVLQDIDNLGLYLFQKLIEKENIDNDYYEVIILRTHWIKDGSFLGDIFTLVYDLKLRECWNNLEECEDRLKVGL